MHICPKPECGAEVMDEMFACKKHWFELPRPIRDEIWRAYRRHGVGSEQLTAAHLAADDWWDEQPVQERLV